jgi:hypothetical protein
MGLAEDSNIAGRLRPVLCVCHREFHENPDKIKAYGLLIKETVRLEISGIAPLWLLGNRSSNKHL